MNEDTERLLDLSEIIRMTGHRTEQAAYTMLRKHEEPPTAYRPATRAPRAVWRESVVRKVFARKIEDVHRIRAIAQEAA